MALLRVLLSTGLAVATVMVIGGCATSSSSRLGVKLPPIKPLRGAPPPSLQGPPQNEPQPIFPWLVVNDFFPPRAQPIVPRSYVPPQLTKTPRAWFPSADDCVSPDGERTLYHLAGAVGSDAMDYVVFVRTNQTHTNRPIFQIRKVLEFLWSPDGTRAAITILTGSNYAEVRLLTIKDMSISEPIATDDALHGYFTPYQLNSPQFVMALSWTATGELLIRARGFEARPPYDLFGYELLVDANHLGYPDAVRFLRGYRHAPNPDVPDAAKHRKT